VTPLRTAIACAVLASAVGSVAGCGSVRYVTRVGEVERTLADAREAGAPVLAPYEYRLASEYLAKAGEEAQQGEYGYATAYLETARVSAAKAVTKARTKGAR
jgi:hypothetical protein